MTTLNDLSDNPLLIITCGCAGEGKSYVAERLGRLMEIPSERNYRTDVIREELVDKGIIKKSKKYTKKNRLKVYEEIFRRVSSNLEKKASCIIDATFTERDLRRRALQIAKTYNGHFVILRVKANESIVRQRFSNKNPLNPSEATFDTYLGQIKEFRDFDSNEQEYVIEINGTNPVAEIEAYSKISNGLKKEF